MASGIDWVVPARDEAATITEVLRALLAAPITNQVIVVDDGSTDATAALAAAEGCRVVPGPVVGKGEAMTAGLTHTYSDRVGFCDADLVGLAPEHAQALGSVACTGQVVGLRGDGPLLRAPPISGQRVVPRAILETTPLQGWDAELALDAACSTLANVHLRLVGQTQRGLPKVTRFADLLRPGFAHWTALVRYPRTVTLGSVDISVRPVSVT